MHKIILSGILGTLIAVFAYAGLHYHYDLPPYIAVPATITAQVVSYIVVLLFFLENNNET